MSVIITLLINQVEYILEEVKTSPELTAKVTTLNPSEYVFLGVTTSPRNSSRHWRNCALGSVESTD